MEFIMTRISALLAASLLLVLSPTAYSQETPSRLKVLFLGDNGHHQPNQRFRQIHPVLDKRGIELVYTDSASALNAKTLAPYDGLLIYANLAKISPEQEKALLDYVASGKGFIPVHCASFCFLNSSRYIE